MTLSICVVTMNRSEQLKEALESCLRCELPRDTEFVVIDNASQDNTEAVIKDILDNNKYHYYYEKMAENLGCGGGRNYAFTKASGKYIYVLDDDAVVSDDTVDFFTKAIDILDSNPKIITLTTQIYDTAWERNRVSPGTVRIKGMQDLYLTQMFCGGSHFMRRDFWSHPPYLSNKYGYEEMLPSYEVINAGCYNAVCTDLLIIHKPKIDKWNMRDERNHELLANGLAIGYAMKAMSFPSIFRPMIELALYARCNKHLKGTSATLKDIKERARIVMKDYPTSSKIKISTVIKMWRQFGLAIF